MEVAAIRYNRAVGRLLESRDGLPTAETRRANQTMVGIRTELTRAREVVDQAIAEARRQGRWAPAWPASAAGIVAVTMEGLDRQEIGLWPMVLLAALAVLATIAIIAAMAAMLRQASTLWAQLPALPEVAEGVKQGAIITLLLGVGALAAWYMARRGARA